MVRPLDVNCAVIFHGSSLPSHVLQTDAGRRERAFDELGKRAYAALLRCRHGEELLDGILLFRFDRGRETPNKSLAQSVSFRDSRGIGTGANQRLNL